MKLKRLLNRLFETRENAVLTILAVFIVILAAIGMPREYALRKHLDPATLARVDQYRQDVYSLSPGDFVNITHRTSTGLNTETYVVETNFNDSAILSGPGPSSNEKQRRFRINAQSTEIALAFFDKNERISLQKRTDPGFMATASWYWLQ